MGLQVADFAGLQSIAVTSDGFPFRIHLGSNTPSTVPPRPRFPVTSGRRARSTDRRHRQDKTTFHLLSQVFCFEHPTRHGRSLRRMFHDKDQTKLKQRNKHAWDWQ